MPDRYHIKVVSTAGRFRRAGKYGAVDWREDCSRCTNCVKLRCVYDTYKKESAHNRDPFAPVQPLCECKACLSCVQGCTKGLLAILLNPEYLAMGDEYWKPDLIATSWNQSETGKVPVSGAGYRGRFYGPGFDSIWTDMSEIVRPTRDGIHGREYISTSVDIGPKPLRMKFAADGAMLSEAASLIEIQMPAILDIPPWPMMGKDLALARFAAARALKTLAIARPEDIAGMPVDALATVVPLLDPAEVGRMVDLLKNVRLAEIADGPEALAAAAKARAANPALVVAVRMSLKAGAADRASELVRGGIRVLHLAADLHGRETGVPTPRHLKDVLREIHGRLVKDAVRDEVTLIAGGGVGLAEHMAKAIICGADLVAVDAPLLIALGCRMCRGAHAAGQAAQAAEPEVARRVSRPAASDVPVDAAGQETRRASAGLQPGPRCPAEIKDADVAYAAQRMINLMGAWHSQLIEVLGAMGIREVRRLRGEVGRAIFMEDIEREAFGDLVRK